MDFIIEREGSVRGICGEEIALDALSTPKITRASHVEPDDSGRWLADLSPVGGPVLGPFGKRSEALDAEVAWLEENWLTNGLAVVMTLSWIGKTQTFRGSSEPLLGAGSHCSVLAHGLSWSGVLRA